MGCTTRAGRRRSLCPDLLTRKSVTGDSPLDHGLVWAVPASGDCSCAPDLRRRARLTMSILMLLRLLLLRLLLLLSGDGFF